jgi:hypothetical protein
MNASNSPTNSGCFAHVDFLLLPQSALLFVPARCGKARGKASEGVQLGEFAFGRDPPKHLPSAGDATTTSNDLTIHIGRPR